LDNRDNFASSRGTLEGNVFFHRETGRPIAIEYSSGVLWLTAGSGAVEQLPDGGQKGIGHQRSRA